MNFKRVGFQISFLLSLLFYICAQSLLYAQWEIEPLVQASIGYSDNIELDFEDEESGFVGILNPGIKISKPIGRLQVELDYLMENFYYLDDDQLDTNHSLDSIARYGVIPNTFFINTFARADQILIDNDQQISVDNFNDTDNTTDEYNYGIGPQWVQDLGGYARADVSYLYSQQRFDDKTAEDGGPGDFDDNDRQNFIAALSNINQQADRFDWLASYEWEEVDFDFGETIEFITQQIDVGYQLTPRLELVGSYGYEDNDLGNNVVFDDDDGTFWTAGAVLGLGEFTLLEIRRGDRFFGNFWLGELTVAGPKLAVNASYEEVADVSGSRDVEFGFEDRVNDLVLLDNDVDFSTDDRNSVSVTKRWSLGVSYNISKSTFLAAASNDDEEILDTGDTEKREIYTLGWIWQLTGISSLSLIAEYGNDESNDGINDTESDFFDFDVSYQKALTPKTDMLLRYVYSEGDSDVNDDDFNSNTIVAGIEHRF